MQCLNWKTTKNEMPRYATVKLIKQMFRFIKVDRERYFQRIILNVQTHKVFKP